MIKYLPDYSENPEKDSEIDEAISSWVTDGLKEDWEWFEQVRSSNFPGHPQARANIEKAIPILHELLKEGQCNIESPDEFFYDDGSKSTEGEDTPMLQRAYGQLKRVIGSVSRSLPSAEAISRIALNASDLAERM